MNLPRILIIEGTDGTGKTTLAHEFASAHGYQYKHAGPPTKTKWYEEYIQPILPYADSSNPHNGIVLDRWHLGEWVWPIVFDRDSLFPTTDDLRACHNFIVSTFGALTIVLSRDLADIREERKDDQPGEAIVGSMLFVELNHLALSNIVYTDLPTARLLLLP